jgi:acyl carrier protein
MSGSQDIEFKTALKKLIIEACDKDVTPEEIHDEEPMFGEGSVLALDSMDALQLSMEIQKVHGVVLADSKELRRVFTSINALADYLKPE